MCLRRRFKRNENVIVTAGAKELVLDLEERCCIRQVAVNIDMNDTTGTTESRLIIKVDEDEVLNESLYYLQKFYNVWASSAHSNRPFQYTAWDATNKIYRMIFIDLGRVERRFAVFFENHDTTNKAEVNVGVIYDILED